MGPPKDLVTSDVTDTSFVASWTAAPGHVKRYRVRWESLFSQETGETAVPGDVTSAVLQGLTPETLYQVSVVAAYEHKDSEPLTGQETTDGKTPARRCDTCLHIGRDEGSGRGSVFPNVLSNPNPSGGVKAPVIRVS